ncbi:MFS general substrate transporter [Coprinopsis marcescibilis]|uniref:MFS general substrate transporter n=1 Tax=Coprinopsis marcescibilis TaxID=230819 RepID=A0A5C3LNF7_COPMA|nr:MFS general substrate transporter [Coprinopsis marcescibilis]
MAGTLSPADDPKVTSRQQRSKRTNSAYNVTQVEALALPDGPISEDAAELLEEFAGTHHHHELDGSYNGGDHSDDDRVDEWAGLPWWRKPSPLWLLGVIPVSALAQSSTLAPKIELYMTLVCRTQKPDVFGGNLSALTSSVDAASSLISPLVNAATSIASAGLPNSCVSDPTVQAQVAKLSAAVTTTMGVLTLLTTAWWGSLSDRKGRAYIMGISLLGLLVTDFNLINVYYFSKYMPGGYWFLLLGPVVEGILGGFSTATAAMHAYLADTTTESNRTRIFSLNLGLIFIGMALGPTMSSLIIRYTGGIISVFFVAAILHFSYAVFTWTILPESLSRAKMVQSRLDRERQLREEASDWSESDSTRTWVLRFKRIFQFLRPLSIFFPVRQPNPNPLKKPSRDWNLTCMAIAYGFTISVMGSYTYTFQYAQLTFAWTSETLGYYLSLVGGARAVFLIFVIPTAIKIFKPAPLIVEVPAPPESHSERQPLLSSTSSNPPDYTSNARMIKKELHSPTFELAVARVSLIAEILAYILMGLAPTGATFAMFGMIASLGVGFSPAIQTCVLALYASKGGTETGRLFGALSVVQALSSQVLGPAIYGLVFAKTVLYLPRAIFFVSVSGFIVSVMLLSLIRLPKHADMQRDIIAAAHANDSSGTDHTGTTEE